MHVLNIYFLTFIIFFTMSRLKIKSMLGLLSFSMILFFFACESGVINEQIEVQSVSDTSAKSNEGVGIYYLDNERVPEGTYELDNEKLRVIVFGGSPKNLKDIDTHYYAFTSEELYLEFSDYHKLELEKLSAFEKDIEDVNRKYNVDKYDNEEHAEGFVPEGYLAAVQKVYDTHFGKSKSQEKIATFIAKNCNTNGPPNNPNNPFSGTMVMPNILPAMWGSWNNSVSEFEFWNVGGVIVIYNRRWLRRRLATCFRWGVDPECLPNGLNDRMSSGLAVSWPL